MPRQIPFIKQILDLACEGTTVAFKQLYSALSPDEIADIKEGSITVDDLRDIIKELTDINSNFDQCETSVENHQSEDIDL